MIEGREGMGKTWVAIDWLQSKLDQLPIVVLVPSKVFIEPVVDRSSFFALIARCFRDLHVEIERDQHYWEARVRRLLGLNVEAREVMILYFDGLNETSEYD